MLDVYITSLLRTFDTKTLLGIHSDIFEQIFDWAGVYKVKDYGERPHAHLKDK
jgi:fido (protein-threonine AMPylation protein)